MRKYDSDIYILEIEPIYDALRNNGYDVLAEGPEGFTDSTTDCVQLLTKKHSKPVNGLKGRQFIRWNGDPDKICSIINKVDGAVAIWKEGLEIPITLSNNEIENDIHSQIDKDRKTYQTIVRRIIPILEDSVISSSTYHSEYERTLFIRLELKQGQGKTLLGFYFNSSGNLISSKDSKGEAIHFYTTEDVKFIERVLKSKFHKEFDQFRLKESFR